MSCCEIARDNMPVKCENIYNTRGRANIPCVQYPLLRSVAHSGRYFAKINGKYYSLHHNHDGDFLYKYVEGKKTLEPVKVTHGEEFDGCTVEIYHSSLL